MLEELLERGEVECALILKGGPYTERELELIRYAFSEGVRLGKGVTLNEPDRIKMEYDWPYETLARWWRQLRHRNE